MLIRLPLQKHCFFNLFSVIRINFLSNLIGKRNASSSGCGTGTCGNCPVAVIRRGEHRGSKQGNIVTTLHGYKQQFKN